MTSLHARHCESSSASRGLSKSLTPRPVTRQIRGGWTVAGAVVAQKLSRCPDPGIGGYTTLAITSIPSASTMTPTRIHRHRYRRGGKSSSPQSQRSGSFGSRGTGPTGVGMAGV